MVIEKFVVNPSVHLESQMHILIKILEGFLTNPIQKISINTSRDEILFRENAAKVLAKLVLGNEESKYPNLKLHLFELLKNKLTILAHNGFRPENYPIISAILKFFSYMDSITIHAYIIDQIYEILEKPEILLIVQGDFYYQNSSNIKIIDHTLENTNKITLSNEHQIFDVILVYETVMLCVTKVLRLACSDHKRTELRYQIFKQMHDKLGEAYTLSYYRIFTRLNYSHNFYENPIRNEENLYVLTETAYC